MSRRDIRLGGVHDHGFASIPNALLVYQTMLAMTPSELNVVLQLWVFKFEGRDTARPALGTVADRMGVSESQVRRLVAGLRERGLMKITARYDERGVQQPNVYDLSPLTRRLDDLVNQDEGGAQICAPTHAPMTPPTHAPVRPPTPAPMLPKEEKEQEEKPEEWGSPEPADLSAERSSVRSPRTHDGASRDRFAESVKERLRPRRVVRSLPADDEPEMRDEQKKGPVDNAPKNANKLGRVIDLITAGDPKAGSIVRATLKRHGGGRDGYEVGATNATADEIAEAFLACWRGDWRPDKDGWLRQNLTIATVTRRVGQYLAWKSALDKNVHRQGPAEALGFRHQISSNTRSTAEYMDAVAVAEYWDTFEEAHGRDERLAKEGEKGRRARQIRDAGNGGGE